MKYRNFRLGPRKILFNVLTINFLIFVVHNLDTEANIGADLFLSVNNCKV